MQIDARLRAVFLPRVTLWTLVGTSCIGSDKRIDARDDQSVDDRETCFGTRSHRALHPLAIQQHSNALQAAFDPPSESIEAIINRFARRQLPQSAGSPWLDNSAARPLPAYFWCAKAPRSRCRAPTSAEHRLPARKIFAKEHFEPTALGRRV